MNRMHPQTLLFVLLGTVPLVVAGAGVAAFLLMRSGHSVVVWAVLPFVGSLLAVAAIAFLLSRAARSDRSRDRSQDRSQDRSLDRGRGRGRDGRGT
jgi:membrane protein implicated in regulation of membrane protease activity